MSTDSIPQSKGFLRTLWSRKWLILVTATLSSGLAFLASTFLPLRYRSEAVVVVVPQRIPEQFVRPTTTVPIDERIQSVLQQVLSRSRLERIIQEFDLYRENRRTRPMEDIIQQMRRDIGFRATAGDVFAVSYEGSSPRVTQKVTDRLTSLVIEESLRDREVLAEGTDQFLQAQLEDVRRQLVEHDKKMDADRAAHSGHVSKVLALEDQVLQESYKALLVKSQESRITKNLERRQIGEQFKLLDPARLPESPVSPDRRRLSVMAGFVGLGLGVVLAGVPVRSIRRKAPTASDTPE